MSPTVQHSGDLPEGCEVVVVGGGIAGTSACYHLAAAGVDVLLLEKGRLGGGATSAAAGILSPPMRQPFQETVRLRGEETARAIWAMAQRSIRSLGELLEGRGEADAAGLDLSGGHVLAEPHTEHEVEESFRALAAAGFPVEALDAPAVRELTGGRGFAGGYRLEGGGSLDPLGTVRSLGDAAAEAGATIREGVALEGVRREGSDLVCETDQGRVGCDAVVHATHVDSKGFSPFLQAEIVPIRGQGFATEPVARSFPGSFATHWKLNVWRQTPARGLVVSGWRHDTWNRAYRRTDPALDEPLQSDLATWFENAFPEVAPLTVARRWSGIFGWTADYLPLVGPLAEEGEYVIAGFSGGGLPFAFEAGRIVARLVVGDDPPPGANLLHPGRFAGFHERA